MPEAWAKLLQNSGITAAEKKNNPQGVIKALEFFTTNRSGIGEGETKFLTAQRMGELLGGGGWGRRRGGVGEKGREKLALSVTENGWTVERWGARREGGREGGGREGWRKEGDWEGRIKEGGNRGS